ncbi:four helix bundle protein [Flavobacterium sp. JP2137]|uniref:four helix bundle protein n=1 Tax=Flavobacterium sp. JP2137 TaxID=3414510 RepID=UPI003D301366
MKTHQDLEVWNRAMDLVTDIYRVSHDFPQQEVHALTDQIRRSAISLPSVIAEGVSKSENGDFIRYLYLAFANNNELETQIIIACNLNFIDHSNQIQLLRQTQTIGKMLLGLIELIQHK